MTEATVRTILRLIAVVTILVGAILVATTLVAVVGAQRAMPSAAFAGVMRDATNEVTFYTVLAHGMVALEGVLLYMLSPALAKKIVAE
jgi:uncharacterized protein YjeT (DUF2065 family)